MEERELDDLLRRVQDEPMNLSLLTGLVEACTELNRVDDAVRPLWVAANAFTKAKNGRAALAVLGHLVTLAPDDSRSLAWLATECAKVALPPEQVAVVQRALSVIEFRAGHLKGVEWLLRYAALPAFGSERPDALGAVFKEKPELKVLQEAAELFEGAGFTEHAARFLSDAAERFTEDGFFMKAVNLLKKAEKLVPARTEYVERLGDLHDALGLHPEAQTYYRAAAARYEKSGERTRLEDVKKRLAGMEKN